MTEALVLRGQERFNINCAVCHGKVGLGNGIIKSFGLSNMQVGFLNAIPPTIAVVAMYLWSWHSDRQNERTWHVIIACCAAAVGLALAGMSSTVMAVVTALTLVNVGISAAKPPLWSMPTLFLSGPAAAAGIATINSIGNLGGFVGPYLMGWLSRGPGDFRIGLLALAVSAFCSGIIVLTVHSTPRTQRSTQAGEETLPYH